MIDSKKEERLYTLEEMKISYNKGYLRGYDDKAIEGKPKSKTTGLLLKIL